jgi:hypothetical protein
MADKRVIWKPQPRQAALMRRWEDEALYGGAAGGGKSDCALAEALRQIHIPHYRGLIFRKTYPQLSELIDRSTELYKSAIKEARYNDSKHYWIFPSGAKIFFGSMQHTKDRVNYQGKRYDFIDFDELTQFTWDEYSYLFSRNRPSGPGTRCYIRAQANPGGVGHGWVKERFITPAPPMTTIWESVKVRFPDGHEEERRRSRVFVPSTVFDNKILLENDPDYLTSLAALPEAERQALLYGDWDSFSGQVFTEWKNDPEHYHDRTYTHVIAPFKVPHEWQIWCSMDWGYTKPFAVAWYAVDHERRIYRIRELYGCTGTPNVGVQWEPARVAKEILSIEADDPNLKGRYIYRVADPAIWGTQTGESIAQVFARAGVYFEKGEHARIDGKMQIHHRLAFDEYGRPMLYVFSTCRNFIRTVPNLVYDDKNVEDINTDGEDHIYDELRYVCMNYVIAPRVYAPIVKAEFDPLASERIEYDEYAFYR